MSWLLILFLVLICASSLYAEKKRYDGYQLFRVDSSKFSADNYTTLEQNHDVWAANSLEGWVDVMVSPTLIKEFSALYKAKVHIENVQTMLDAHEAEMSQTIPNDIFDSFPTTGQTLTWLNQQIAAHPSVTRRFVLGKTYLGTDIIGIHIASDNTKPIFFIHCTIHAREWITTTTCLWIIDNLLNIDPQGPALIADYQWLIVPILNVDGYDYTHTTDRLWRKGRSPNSGSTCVGTDLNRNFGYAWGGPGSSNNPCSETYRGTNAFSTPEIASLRDFLKPYMDSSTLAIYMDIHSYGGQVASPWAYTNTHPPDYPEMDRIMESTTFAINAINGRNYVYGSSADVIYISSGGSKDWVYGDSGVIPSFSIECFGSSFTPPLNYIPSVGRELYMGMKTLAQQVKNK